MKPIARKSFTQPATSAITQRLYEGFLIIGVAISLFFLLALVTYHSSDPSWSHLTDSKNTLNAAGRVGAWLADFIFYSFGYIAYSIPILLGYGSWLAYQKVKDNAEANQYLLLVKLIGIFLILIAGSSLASLAISNHNSYLPAGSGGAVGDLVGAELANVFNKMGSNLLLLATLLIGITLFSGLSWLSLMDLTGRLAIKALKFSWLVLTFFYRLALRLAKQRAAELHAAKARAEQSRAMIKDKAALSVTCRKEPQLVATAPVDSPVVRHAMPTITAVEPEVEATKKSVKVVPAASLKIVKPAPPNATGIPSLDLLEKGGLTKQQGYSNEVLEIGRAHV